jgi:redox-sensitive bicupin YhaK (pirin superfamily)
LTVDRIEEVMKSRSVNRTIKAQRTIEGGGFVVRRPFPTRTLEHFDPFLLLDEMGPSDNGPGDAKGAPDHPHRGFETVTYLLEGEFQHKDSAGNRGDLRAGDVQWMTAGDGVVHSEMPSEKLMKEGGRLHGFQIWVNLPKKDKRIKPRYQDTPSAKIPVVTSADGKTRVKVIAGESIGTSAVIETRTPILYLHVTLQPGGELAQAVPSDFSVFAYVFDGEGSGDMIVFGDDGDGITLSNPSSAPREILVLGGRPLREPIARYGPFVMNTRQEIEEAIDDFRAGRMGEIA